MKYLFSNKLQNLDQYGASLVEMAIVIGLFFTLFFGIMDFSFLMYNRHIITNSSREAARAGVVSRPDELKITKTDVENIAKNYAEANLVSFGPDNFSVDVEFESGTQCVNFQDKLIVNVSYQHSFLFLPFNLDKVEARAVMLCE